MKRCALIVLFGVSAAATAESAQRARPVKDEPRVVRGAQVGRPMPAMALDVDLRDLPLAPEWEPGDPIKDVPLRMPLPEVMSPPVTSPMPDPLLARQPSPPEPNTRGFETPIIHFDAQNFAGSNPPDTVGDVGPNHYVQAINATGGARMVVYDKATGAVLAGPVLLSQLGAPSPCNVGFGDPVVLYDALADRWLLAEFPMGGNHMCFYVSRTPDPVSGGWWFYHLGPLAQFPDYPKLGVWPDAYYMTTNEGNAPPAWALDRTNMLTGATARPPQRFTVPGLPGFVFESLTPADLDGATLPPPGAPGIFARHRDDEVHDPPGTPSDFLEMWEFHVDFDTPANSTLTTLPRIAVSDFSSELCGLGGNACVPQPVTTTRMDTLSPVIMFRLQYRNLGTQQALVGNFTVDADGEPDNPPNLERQGPRWFELRKAGTDWTLFQEGTHSPDANPRWMGAIAEDQDGNIALGYSVSNAPNVFPSLRYAGRQAADRPGTLRQEVELATGADFNSSSRWGDYAAMSVDPVDDCTFWFTSLYSPLNSPVNRWRTHVGAFKFDSCGNAIPANNAVFDPALQAPSCTATGRSCDSAATLVGRDTITGGAEPNQPNTIAGSCPDGTGGRFHVRESIDRIRVQTLDGTALAAGKTVRVDVAVWAWSRAFADTLEVFFTADATQPSWARVGSVRVARPGAQTLSLTYTLPAGALQAVRARFRYLGESGRCGSGPYDDHDDLAFAVQ